MPRSRIIRRWRCPNSLAERCHGEEPNHLISLVLRPPPSMGVDQSTPSGNAVKESRPGGSWSERNVSWRLLGRRTRPLQRKDRESRLPRGNFRDVDFTGGIQIDLSPSRRRSSRRSRPRFERRYERQRPLSFTPRQDELVPSDNARHPSKRREESQRWDSDWHDLVEHCLHV
jgi:hypothetical protein